LSIKVKLDGEVKVTMIEEPIPFRWTEIALEDFGQAIGIDFGLVEFDKIAMKTHDGRMIVSQMEIGSAHLDRLS
jgi:hypothetical protein